MGGVDRTAEITVRELIFDPLGLRDTYAFTDPDDRSPAPMYYKDKPTRLPRYIASITPAPFSAVRISST